jgi:enoyl-[acyl-carrier protein] reductase II
VAAVACADGSSLRDQPHRQTAERGGFRGVSTLLLVPAVVDIAGGVPVVAAGGIADGRGIAADATEVVKVPHSERVMPPFTIPQLGVPYAPRSLRTELTDRLESAPEEVDPDVVGPELLRALRSGGGQDMLPFTGQSVELVHDVLPTQDLIARLISEAEEAARRAVQLSCSVALREVCGNTRPLTAAPATARRPRSGG